MCRMTNYLNSINKLEVKIIFLKTVEKKKNFEFEFE